MKCFIIWYKDGSAKLINADNKAQAHAKAIDWAIEAEKDLSRQIDYVDELKSA